ncbi:hypothetical protein [Paraflavitalea speifideaquila]|uniref:hypothetical protein n=1 Tax=Paraflavitalea speifideaquila TaxID=3076558 RepID=UPI0028E63117|nr:hypothetical protein [Paraflavitalea speifideiaquila]
MYQYNGNISTSVWKSKGDQVRRKFNFQYDAANRLGKAGFYQNSTPGTGGTGTTVKPISVSVVLMPTMGI